MKPVNDFHLFNFSTNAAALSPMGLSVPSAIIEAAAPVHCGYGLLDFQHEDVAAVLEAYRAGKRAVLCRWATGLGKSVLISELARQLSSRGRVLVVVDVGSLAADLAASIRFHTGEIVGVLTGNEKENWKDARVVVATVQTLYAGAAGREWFREFSPCEFAAVLCDECESSLADRFSEVIEHFIRGNPQAVLCGTSATPFRGDGQKMGALYDHASNQPGPLNRDILWGRDNGRLVHIKQGFVRVSLDFSSLKLRKDDDGVNDFTDAGLLKLFEDETAIIELAKGIHAVAKEQPSIVICPNSVDFAKALSNYLDAERRGCAKVVYGEQGTRADEILDAYKRGDFPYIVSVNKLYKGFDSDRVNHVFMCRKTKSRRLYEQALGRGTRPLKAIRPLLYAEPEPCMRREIIAESDKPFTVMVDMVGVAEKAKDLLGVIDVLGAGLSHAARDRAKQKMLELPEGDTAPIDTEDVGRAANKQVQDEAREREEAELRRRRQVQVAAEVDVEITDDLRATGSYGHAGKVTDGGASEKQINLLIAFGVRPATARSYGPRQASGVIGSYFQRGNRPDWGIVRRYERNKLIGVSGDIAHLVGATEGEL